MFIVEDGTIVAGANSLASVEFADSYHADRRNSAWAEVSLEQKQALLVKATDYFSGVYGMALKGTLVSVSQPLPFPRMVAYTNVGNPILIQQSIAEFALIAKTTPLTPVVNRGKKKVKVGPIEVEYDGNSATAPKFTAATMKLAPWLENLTGGMQVRLQRV